MNIYLSIAFTLLAGVAGMYLLAKTRAEQLGKIFSIFSYLVILVALLSLVCQLGRAACWMACSSGICEPSENCMPGMMMHKRIMMHGMSGDCKMNSGCDGMEECCSSEKCGEGMRECRMECKDMKMGGHGKCCDEMKEGGEECGEGMMHGKMKHDRMMKDDTTSKK